jgi:tetratricopeptide (TPR) repeat protein
MLPGLEKPLAQITVALEEFSAGGSNAPLLLSGPPAAGRRTLLQRVEDQASSRKQKCFGIELMPFGHDAPAHILLQIASQAPDTSDARALTAIGTPWKTRLAAADSILDSASSRIFLVRFPAGALPTGERSDRQVQSETVEVLDLVTKPRADKLHVIAANPWWKWPHNVVPRRIPIEVSSRSSEFLLNESQWGSLKSAAQRLSRLLGVEGDRLSPLQLRLGVALLAGGMSPAVIRSSLGGERTLRDLEPALRRLLERRPQLQAALVRVARARTAVDADVLRDVASAGDEWELVSKCFLYPEQGGKLRFHDQLRWLVPDVSAESAVHARLRSYYQTLGGTADPAQGLRHVVPWLETIHHASRADSEGNVEAWLALNPPAREHYWEFGWSLSYVHGRFDAAARVYRTLLDRIPNEDDNYGQHYYAYNLDRAGADPIAAERYYRRAVAGDPTNPWWNSRFVSFLTEQGRFESALQAWNAALEAIDSGGERSAGEWLPNHFHKHVIRAALDSGNLDLAEAAFRAVQPPASSDEVFQWLGSQIGAAREVRRLGEALFPASVNVSEWWRPRLLTPRHGENFSEWRAGRVLTVNDREVAVALGFRGVDKVPVLEYQVLPLADWKQAAKDSAAREGDFFEVALIDGKRRLESEPPAAATELKEDRIKSLLRFVSTLPWQK